MYFFKEKKQYDLGLPWMSGQNSEIDRCLVDSEISKSETSLEQERSELLQVMSSNLRDEGWLFALLYIVKWTEKKV